MCWDVRQRVFVSGALHLSNFVSSGAGFARMVTLICSAMKDSMPVIRHIAANLANSMAVVIVTSGAHSLNTTRPRHTVQAFGNFEAQPRNLSLPKLLTTLPFL